MGKGEQRKGDVRKKYRANNMGAQWWRKLSLPRRGKKETLLSPVAESLPATHIARVNKRRTRLRKAVEAPRSARSKSLAVADWVPERGLVRVVSPRGHLLSSMGFFEDGVQWLYPEEGTYLVDRGQLDYRVDGVPASLQRVWGLMAEGVNAISLEEYCAYSHLRRVGYVVRRFGLDAIDETVCDEDEDANVDVPTGATDNAPPGIESDQGHVEGDDCVVPDLSVKESFSRGRQTPSSVIAPKTPESLRPSFAIWRVGAYRRKSTGRALFHLVVSRYEDPPPSHEDLTAALSACTGKTRLRMALIDRGVVVLVDVANKATPLSKRYLDRLPTGPSSSVVAVEDARVGVRANVPIDVPPVDSLPANTQLTELTFLASKTLEGTGNRDLEHIWQFIQSSSHAGGCFAAISRSQVLSALQQLAQQDRVVLSSGSNPTVYVSHELRHP